MIARTLGWIGVFAGAIAGAVVGTWTQAPYPVSNLERNILTPIVRPGDELRIEIVADRRERCDQNVTRFIQYPDGDRGIDTRELPSTYGRMGRDVYVVSIPTDPNSPYGPAEVYTTAEAKCNPYQRYVKAVTLGEPYHDKFEFGPETKSVPGRFSGQYRPTAER